ncbi:MAG: Rne/Rng family ribonuclease [Candidatus Korobacteraceae bacterium]|jgi:ribonuclease G
MNKELYVSSTPHETKVALVEDDLLAEVFFERENEYTLAGSIYKGRVTRVLPGMQSAFVDIGLERDAFLYVSDFLEVTGDEEDEEEFGSIPVPRNAIDVSKAYAAQEAQLKAESAVAEPEIAEEFEVAEEDFPAPAEEQTAGEETEASSTADPDSAEGTRPWRGRRRRRGGRRGQGDERNDRPEPKIEPAKPVEEAPAYHAETRPPARPRADYGPPAGYTPIVLPGESISKYRNLSQQPAPGPKNEETTEQGSFAPVGDSSPSVDLNAHVDALVKEPESQAEFEPGNAASEPGQTERVTAPPAESAFVIEHEETEQAEAAHQDDDPEPRERLSVASSESHGAESDAVTSPATATELLTATAENPTLPQDPPAEVQSTDFPPAGENREQNHREGATQQSPGFQSLAAPSVAPVGRTLEHEVLEDEEMEFHPVPDDLSAMSEVEGDEELVLEEETLDADNGDSDRWIPKIADVDEDEVVAAEERGEQIYGPEADEEEEEEPGEGEATNGRAEVRAASPTAGYQQRQTERPGYDRRGFRDRNRRGGPRRNFRARPNTNRNQPLITDLLKEGQEVLIQIAKEPIGKKGARITSHIALPGRFLVYMPTVNHVGVSRKIASDEERQRLKRIVTSERENGLGGFIVRTAAANIKEEDLRADIRFLKHLWAEIKSRTENSKSPALIYHDLNLVERILRDQVNADFSQIWVDTEDEYERVVRFASRFQPSLVRRIKLYTKDTPLFEQFGIQDEINRSLKSKVWLKSGGHIVINQTEALVAIDINTGKYVGKTQRLEDTIAKTNVDAVKEIVRQIRLRDLGGIIVIDFIDMDERKNRQKVMQALEEALRNDRAPSKVLQFNDFGLVAITRKRVKQSLERTLGETCPYCVGAGFVKSVPTVCNELYIEMRKMAKVHDKTDITLRVNPEVAKALKANNGKLISEMEDLTGKTVLVKSDPLLHQENFDIH